MTQASKSKKAEKPRQLAAWVSFFAATFVELAAVM
jgi:hypothetical protein